MESWSYTCGGRDFGLDDSGNVEVPGISSELKSPWSYDQGDDQIQEFVELGSSYMMRKTLPNNSIGDSFASKTSDGRVISSVPVSANAFSCEDDSSSMFSSSVIKSSPRDSLSIDMKLGRLNDQGDNRANANFSSSESSIPVKRARAGGLGSQTPYCQVYGCRKDLSSCKDYHKRHKVCEIHSKTTKVIVNGIEQRFCQQCSRFHLLPEFDDGKRSCRKRLAGHNERRRKPHIRIHAGRAGRLFQSFNTTRTEGNSLSSSSFICQDIPSTCHLRDHNNSSRLVKLEEDGSSIMTNCQINENNSYFQDSSFDSHIAFPASLDSSFINRGLSDMADSGRALSLLSSQSQCSTILTSGIPSILPLVSSGTHALFELTKQPEKLVDNTLVSTGGAVSNAMDRILQQSTYMNSRNRFPFQQDPTIDLLQLSSQLQRVEHQRQSSIMQHEDDDYSGFRNT